VSPQPSAPNTSPPTIRPTFDVPIYSDARFRQQFTVGNGRIFNPTEVSIFETLYQSYTKNFALAGDSSQLEDEITTTCVVDNQEGLVERRFLRFTFEKGRIVRRRLQGDFVQAINMDFTMAYESVYHNVSSYPILFQNWINQNLVTVTTQMQLLQLNVTEAQTASRLIVRTPAPSSSMFPSAAPTDTPTITSYPSDFPTIAPSALPTFPPTDGSSDNAGVVIGISLLIGCSIIGIGLFIYFRKRRRRKELEEARDKAKQENEGAPPEGGWNGNDANLDPNYEGEELPENNYNSVFRKYADGRQGPEGVLSPSESLVSNQSLLSAGNSMAGDSGDEADTTQIFADEFDQYKDQNLEKMRAEIEGNLEGCDGMMSQAVARALIDEDDLNFGTTDYLWGGTEFVTGPEIEASALGDMMDWLKRHDQASVEEK
jgi:hypothetical protein